MHLLTLRAPHFGRKGASFNSYHTRHIFFITISMVGIPWSLTLSLFVCFYACVVHDLLVKLFLQDQVHVHDLLVKLFLQDQVHGSGLAHIFSFM
jgi:hypothetical protein